MKLLAPILFVLCLACGGSKDAKVRVLFGNQSQRVPAKIKAEGGSNIQLADICNVHVFNIDVNGPGFPRITESLIEEIDMTNYPASTSPGEELFNSSGIEIVVPKGPDRKFVLSGFFQSPCNGTGSGVKHYMFGSNAGPMEINGPKDVFLDAVATTQYFQASETWSDVDVSGTDYVRLDISYTQGACSSYMEFRAKDITTGRQLRAYQQITPPSASFFAGPFFPNRPYKLQIWCGSTLTLHKEIEHTTTNVDGQIVYMN